MKTQTKVENTLKQIHLLFARSRQYKDNPDEVIVNKKEFFKLLEEVNRCMYDMMDEYEVTKESRDRLVRQSQRKGEEIIDHASKNAEDIYAASVLYTDSALNEVRSSMETSIRAISDTYTKFMDDMEKQMRTISDNKYELKKELGELLDSGKYLRLIEAENRKDAKTRKAETEEWIKKGGNASLAFTMPEVFKEDEEPIRIVAPAAEIKVNPAFAENTILDSFKEPQTGSQGLDIKVDLDAEYFKWKEGRDKKVDLDAEYFAWQEEQEQKKTTAQQEEQENLEPQLTLDLDLVKRVAAKREQEIEKEEKAER